MKTINYQGTSRPIPQTKRAARATLKWVQKQATKLARQAEQQEPGQLTLESIRFQLDELAADQRKAEIALLKCEIA